MGQESHGKGGEPDTEAITFTENAPRTSPAELRKERKHMGLADVHVLLTARKLKGKVVTGDEDFRGMKEAIIIK